jgi:hypothetical protein
LSVSEELGTFAGTPTVPLVPAGTVDFQAQTLRSFPPFDLNRSVRGGERARCIAGFNQSAPRNS